MDEVKIQWHSGFVAAMELELTANKRDLLYEREYNLNTKPLEIDLLVIKKDGGILIKNEIGRLFRGHNILEYKAPEDHLNIDTFYKTIAYACLYKSYGNTVDERKADDITISIIREEKPEKLIKYLESRGIRITNPFQGIYYIQERHLFPTQIIVIKELNREIHTWLKSLSKTLEKDQFRNLLECIDKLKEKGDKELADAVLEVSIRANQQIVEELRGEEVMCQALLEIMEPEINKIVDEATKRAKEEAERVKKEAEEVKKNAEKAKKETRKEDIESVVKMLKSGRFSIEEIKEYMPRLSINEIQEIRNELFPI